MLSIRMKVLEDGVPVFSSVPPNVKHVVIVLQRTIQVLQFQM